VNGNESCDAIQVRKTYPPIEWLPANRWRVPGSWRRSRLSEIDSPLTGPSEPAAPEGILFSGAWSFEIPPAEAGAGDPDPWARAGRRAPEARGLPEGTRRKPDTDGRADQERVRYGGAPFRAPQQNLFLNFVRRILRLNERWR